MTILTTDLTKQDIQSITDVQTAAQDITNGNQTSSINGNVDSAESAVLAALVSKATTTEVGAVTSSTLVNINAARDNVNGNVDAAETAILARIASSETTTLNVWSHTTASGFIRIAVTGPGIGIGSSIRVDAVKFSVTTGISTAVYSGGQALWNPSYSACFYDCGFDSAPDALVLATVLGRAVMISSLRHS
jgi:hypothetical protein